MVIGKKYEQVTTFGGLSRSQLMARIAGRGNKSTELHFAKLLRGSGLKGWRRHQRLPGRPDFMWKKQKVVVFLDGCFWHGHDCGRNLAPKTNKQIWREKIFRNKSRDRRVRRSLKKMGWAVVGLWECDLHRNPARCLNRLRLALERD